MYSHLPALLYTDIVSYNYHKDFNETLTLIIKLRPAD